MFNTILWQYFAPNANAFGYVENISWHNQAHLYSDHRLILFEIWIQFLHDRQSELLRMRYRRDNH